MSLPVPLSEVVEVLGGGVEERYYVILDCGHWITWTGTLPPKKGEEFGCPTCRLQDLKVTK